MAKERNFGLDLVRVMAMVFVVAVHSLCVIDWESRSSGWYALAAYSLFFSANALFFILSGKLNLRERDESKLGTYYYRKVRAILVPIVIFFLIRSIYDCFPELSFGSVARAFVYGAIGGFANIEYWFMFTLFGFLMAAPFLAPIFAKMGSVAAKVFIGLGIGFHALQFVAENLGYSFGWGYPFEGFIFVFCLGALVNRFVITWRREKILYLVSLTCFVLAVLLKYFGWSVYVHDQSPLYTIYSVGLFVLISKRGGALAEAWSAKVKACITKVAEHSFSVYMIHMMVLMPCASWFCGFYGVASIGAQVGLTMVTLALSLALAFIADWLLIRPCQKGLDKLYALVKGLRAPKQQDEPMF